MFRKKNVTVFLLCAALLGGCGNQSDTQVTEIPYDPYNFTPRDFLEEGGWNQAKTVVDQELPNIFCDSLGIVLNPDEQYKDILTVSGDIYDFSKATMKCAVLSKAPEDEDNITYVNRLDVIYRIPVEQNGLIRDTTFDVIFTDITRSRNGEYNSVTVTGFENMTAYLECRDGITINANYVENTADVQEPLDYGILYCTDIGENDDPDSVYRGLYQYALELEETRINTYILEHTHENAPFFSTNGNAQTCKSSSYTVEFNDEDIFADLSTCAKNYGLSVYTEPLPTKEKKIKKEGWEVFSVPYDTTLENGKTAQSYFKECVRDVYLLNEKNEIGFLIQYDETTVEAVINIYYREKTSE